MKLNYTKFQLLLEFIAFIILLLTWIYLIVSWKSIPDLIPSHYNAKGVVDNWSSKNSILIFPITSIILYALLTVVTHFPSLWNVPVKISESNWQFVYGNLRTMLILLRIELIAVFAYLMYCIINTQTLGRWFLPIVLILTFGMIIYYILKIIIKKSK